MHINLRDLCADREFTGRLFTLTFPIMMQSLMLSLVAAGDAFMLGRLSQDAMAAVSLASQVQFIQNMVLNAIVGGVGVLGAQYWGRRDTSVIGQLFGMSIREALLASLPFFVGCLFFPEMLMRLFANDPILIGNGAEYLRVASWSYLLAGVSQCYLAIMRVSDHAGRSALISSGAVILNILFNALLIFGLCGFPAMGIAGAAVATIIARVIELAWCMASSRQKGFIRLKPSSLLRFNWWLVADFWRYAAPILGSSLLWGVGFTAYTAILGQLGRDPAAANSIASVVRDILCCICNGIAGGSAILIGNVLGANQLDKGRLYGDRVMVMSIIIGFFSMLVILALIPVMETCMDLTPKAQEYLNGMFVILAVYMIGRCICGIEIGGVFSPGGDTYFDAYSLVVFMWCFALPCAFLGAFYFKVPVLAVYACTCLDEVGKVPWVLHHHCRHKWVKNITRNN